MPNYYRYKDMEFKSDDEYDTEQLRSIVDMIEGKPFTSSVLQNQIPNPFQPRTQIPRPPSVTPPNQANWGDTAVTSVMRVGGPLLGGFAGAATAPVTGPFGAIGGGITGSTLGETAAQGYEKWRGLRNEMNPSTIAVEGALGLIPASKAVRAPLRIGLNAISGATQASVGEGARILTEEGRIPEYTDFIIPATVGSTLSGGVSALGVRGERLAQDRINLRQEASKAAGERLARNEADTRLGLGRVRIKSELERRAGVEAVEQNRVRTRQQQDVDLQVERAKQSQIMQQTNAIKDDIYSNADQAVEAATSKRREKWIADQIAANKNKKGPGRKTVAQIRQEANDIELNKPATNAVRVAAMRRYARELGLDPDDIDGSVDNRIRSQYQTSTISSEGFDVRTGAPTNQAPTVQAPPTAPNISDLPIRPGSLASEIPPTDTGPGSWEDWQARAQSTLDRIKSGGEAPVQETPRKLGGSGWTAKNPDDEVQGFATASQSVANDMAANKSSAAMGARDTAALASRMDESDNPIVREILENDPDAVVDLSVKIPTAQTLWNKYVTSRLQKLTNIGGEELVRNIQTYEREIPQITADLGKRVDDVFTGLGTDPKLVEQRWNNVIERRLDPTITALDQEADIAYQKMRQIDQYKGQLWTAANLEEFKTTPKPMAYDVGFWGNTDTLQEALKAKYPGLTWDSAQYIANGSTNLDDAAEAAFHANISTAAGMKADALEKFWEQNAKKAGRAPEHDLMVQLDLPGFKSGIEAVKMDNISFAERVAKTKLANLDELYAKTKNPTLAKALSEQVIGFKKYRPDEQHVGRTNQIVGRYATARMLGSYFISNMANINGTILEAGAGKTLSAVARLLTSSAARKEAGEIATEAGTNVNLSRGMLQELQGNDPFAKWIMNPLWTKQIEVAENMIRTLNATVGREYAQSLFGKLKTGNITEFEKMKLLKYTLAKDADTLANQANLTEKQLKYAAYGFTERTQGTRSGLNVSPILDTEHELINTLTAFKRYSAQSTKLIKDSIIGPDLTKTERVRNFTRLFLASQAMGEITGDIKATIKGGVMDVAEEVTGQKDRVNHTKKEVMERGEWLNYIMKGWLGEAEIPHVVSRMADNMIQGWMFGTLADLALSGAGGPKEISKSALGPVIPDAIEMGYGALVETPRNLIQGKDVIAPDRWKRQAIRMVPIVGPGLAGAIAPTAREQGRNKSMEDYFVKDTQKNIVRPIKKLFR